MPGRVNDAVVEDGNGDVLAGDTGAKVGNAEDGHVIGTASGQGVGRVTDFDGQRAGSRTHERHRDAAGVFIYVCRGGGPLDHAAAVGGPGIDDGDSVGDGGVGVVVVELTGAVAFIEEGGKFKAVGRGGSLVDILNEHGTGSGKAAIEIVVPAQGCSGRSGDIAFQIIQQVVTKPDGRRAQATERIIGFVIVAAVNVARLQIGRKVRRRHRQKLRHIGIPDFPGCEVAWPAARCHDIGESEDVRKAGIAEQVLLDVIDIRLATRFFDDATKK